MFGRDRAIGHRRDDVEAQNVFSLHDLTHSLQNTRSWIERQLAMMHDDQKSAGRKQLSSGKKAHDGLIESRPIGGIKEDNVEVRALPAELPERQPRILAADFPAHPNAQRSQIFPQNGHSRR